MDTAHTALEAKQGCAVNHGRLSTEFRVTDTAAKVFGSCIIRRDTVRRKDATETVATELSAVQIKGEDVFRIEDPRIIVAYKEIRGADIGNEETTEGEAEDESGQPVRQPSVFEPGPGRGVEVPAALCEEARKLNAMDALHCVAAEVTFPVIDEFLRKDGTGAREGSFTEGATLVGFALRRLVEDFHQEIGRTIDGEDTAFSALIDFLTQMENGAAFHPDCTSGIQIRARDGRVISIRERRIRIGEETGGTRIDILAFHIFQERKTGWLAGTVDAEDHNPATMDTAEIVELHDITGEGTVLGEERDGEIPVFQKASKEHGISEGTGFSDLGRGSSVIDDDTVLTFHCAKTIEGTGSGGREAGIIQFGLDFSNGFPSGPDGTACFLLGNFEVIKEHLLTVFRLKKPGAGVDAGVAIAENTIEETFGDGCVDRGSVHLIVHVFHPFFFCNLTFYGMDHVYFINKAIEEICKEEFIIGDIRRTS